jgi:hypothetical protein
VWDSSRDGGGRHGFVVGHNPAVLVCLNASTHFIQAQKTSYQEISG